MKEVKKCPRCNTETFLELHHVLPKTTFFGKGKIIEICPNCHSEYHKLFGKTNLKNEDEGFHEYSFWKWYYTGTLLLLALIGIYMILK